jgi:hypothetical protein
MRQWKKEGAIVEKRQVNRGNTRELETEHSALHSHESCSPGNISYFTVEDKIVL